jgi:hypothetical protein
MALFDVIHGRASMSGEEVRANPASGGMLIDDYFFQKASAATLEKGGG